MATGCGPTCSTSTTRPPPRPPARPRRPPAPAARTSASHRPHGGGRQRLSTSRRPRSYGRPGGLYRRQPDHRRHRRRGADPGRERRPRLRAWSSTSTNDHSTLEGGGAGPARPAASSCIYPDKSRRRKDQAADHPPQAPCRSRSRTSRAGAPAGRPTPASRPQPRRRTACRRPHRQVVPRPRRWSRTSACAWRRGEVAGLLGPNGAGKTTCFYMITGLIAADYGAIYLDGEDITAQPMYQRARAWASAICRRKPRSSAA